MTESARQPPLAGLEAGDHSGRGILKPLGAVSRPSLWADREPDLVTESS